MTQEMTVEEHLRTALEFLEHADREFAAGDTLLGSEKLWGAASHAVLSIAKKKGWRFGKYNARVAAVDRLAQEHDDPLLSASFSVAQKFHTNFYRDSIYGDSYGDSMEDDEIERDRPTVNAFVRRVAGLVEEE